MFLIPACIALVADTSIVILHRSLAHDAAAAAHDDDENADEHGKAIYKVGYLAVLAWFRILVLVFPLLFHSYTGTALSCQALYLTWYALTLTAVVVHALTLCLVTPESLEALVPEREGAVSDLHLYRRLWYTLLLSVTATSAHLTVLQHVKSSAPRHGLFLPSSSSTRRRGDPKPPVSMYFAVRAHPVLRDEPALVHAMNGAFSFCYVFWVFCRRLC